MASLSERQLDVSTMLGQVEQVVKRGQPGDPPAFTLILGAGASFGVVPTAKQMLGLPDGTVFHPQCVPAFLHAREQGTSPVGPELEKCVRDFWARASADNQGRCKFDLSADGFPTSKTVPEAYQFIFDQRCTGGLNSPGDARDYLRHVTLGQDERQRLNGTHFFLGSLLSLQNRSPEDKGAADRPLYVGKRPFARTIFTTNFDPLLQVSLQLFQNLYYMTDRPELLATDALHTDDHPALHLFYAHGSVHRPGPKNTEDEIRSVKNLNAKAIAPYFATHGVIVLGYSGWDDCLLRALNESTSFQHNLYWLAREQAPISEAVEKFLISHPNAFLVRIPDGGDFMAALHRRLCPGMATTELLANPIAPLRERLASVDLAGISAEPVKSSEVDGQTADKASTPEELRQQVVAMLEKMEKQFSQPGAVDDPELELQKLEHRADLAYANKDYEAALPLYAQIAEHEKVSVTRKANALFSRGFCHVKEGRRIEALADWTLVIESPGIPAQQVALALYNRGVCHGQEGRFAEAIADYTRVIELPGIPVQQVALALYNRGVCHGQEGRSAEAIADYTRVIELPSVPAEHVAQALNNRGVCHGREGRSAEAIADFTRVIKLPGVSAEQVAKALYNRGVRHGQEGRFAEAIVDYTRVIELPCVPAVQAAKALNNRGVCHGEEGRSAEAIADSTRVIELPGVPAEQVANALFNRGVCHGREGRFREKHDDYKRLIELPSAPAELIEAARSWLEQENHQDHSEPGPPAKGESRRKASKRRPPPRQGR